MARTASRAASTPPVPLTRPPVAASRSSVPVGGHHLGPGGDGGQRVAAHEGVPAPPLAALHRLEQEAGPVPSAPTIWRKAATGVRVSATSSRHTGTMRCWAASVRNPAGSRPLGSGSRTVSSWSGGRVAEGPEEAACGCRCGTPRHRPGPPPPAARRRHSRSARSARTAGRRTSRPCTRTPGGSGSRTRSGRSRGSGQRLAVHPGEHQDGPVRGVLDDGPDQPVGVVGHPSSSSSVKAMGTAVKVADPAAAGGVVGCPGGAHERCSLVDWFGVVRSVSACAVGVGSDRRLAGDRRRCPSGRGGPSCDRLVDGQR